MLQRLLIITLTLCSLSASAQWQQTGSKVRYVNGLGIPTKDTAAGVAADSSQILIRPADSSLYIKYKRTWVKVGAGGGGGVGGSGTTNYVPKFTAGTTLGNSQIFDNGTNVGIGTTSPGYKLDVNVTDAGVGSKTIIASFGRIGASASATAREAGIVFRDADNPTLTGGITGVRENSFGNFLSGLNFYVQSNISTAATSFSNLTEAMRITSGANVGIGYTAPAARLAVNGTTLINTNTDNGVYKLQVSGSSIASTLKVNTSGQTTTISNY
jgi:hypothetical protein